MIYPGGLNWSLEPVQVTLPKLPLWEIGSTSKDTWLWITLPRTTQGDSPEAVPLWSLTTVSSPHSITECPSEVVTGPSLTKDIADLLSNPMFEMPGDFSTCNSPYSMAKKMGNPQSRRGTPGLPETTTSLSSWILTGGYGQCHGPFQVLPVTWYSREGHQPYSSPVDGQLLQPVRRCIVPPRGNEWCNGSSTLLQGHNRHAPPMGPIRNRNESSPKWNWYFWGYQRDKGSVCHCDQRCQGCLWDCLKEGRGCLTSSHQQSNNHPSNWDQEKQPMQCSLNTAMAASESHVESGRGGPWGGEGYLSVLSLGLWSSPPCLFQWCSSKPDVSSPSVNGEPIPPQTSDGNFTLGCKDEESCYLPPLPY